MRIEVDIYEVLDSTMIYYKRWLKLNKKLSETIYSEYNKRIRIIKLNEILITRLEKLSKIYLCELESTEI